MKHLRQVPNCPGYLVSIIGEVYSLKPVLRELRGSKRDIDGRVYITMRVDGKKVTMTPARIVLLAFAGPPPTDLHEACHKDGDHSNNLLWNLYWGTHAENMQDMQRHGTQVRGEEIWSARFTSDQVRAIREDFASGMRQCDLIRKYGGSKAGIRAIVTNRTWTHLCQT